MLADDKELRMKFKGVEQRALVWAAIRPHMAEGYQKGYKGEYTIQKQSIQKQSMNEKEFFPSLIDDSKTIGELLRIGPQNDQMIREKRANDHRAAEETDMRLRTEIVIE